MAYLTVPQLRDRLPLDGDGVTDEQLAEAIEAAVETVSALTGDAAGSTALARAAVASYAHADALDIVFPRDARDETAQAVILRQGAERALAAHARTHPALPEAPREDPPVRVPDGYIAELRY